jgi:hypothetical protein
VLFRHVARRAEVDVGAVGAIPPDPKNYGRNLSVGAGLRDVPARFTVDGGVSNTCKKNNESWLQWKDQVLRLKLFNPITFKADEISNVPY